MIRSIARRRDRLIEIEFRYKTSSHLTNLILFRNRDGEIYRAARLELMES